MCLHIRNENMLAGSKEDQGGCTAEKEGRMGQKRWAGQLRPGLGSCSGP